MTRHKPALASISTIGITHLQKHNPIMVAWWSAVFPGFGHYLLNQYLRATLLTMSEVTVNTLAHINEAMVYSFCGKFELARSVIHPTWAFGYLIIYLITILDSYRSTVTQNKLCHLAYAEHYTVQRIGMFPAEVQYLEKKKTFGGVLYSFFFPGLGQLYNHQIALAFYAMLWWWFYLVMSRLHESLLFLVHGNLHQSSLILHPHWLLFMPSVMGGSIYFAYVTTVEHNRLFCIAQRHHLLDRYGRNNLDLFHE